MLVCVFASAWIMTFSYGLYQNFHTMAVEGETSYKSLRPEIVEGETLTHGEFKEYLDSISSDMLNDADIILCETFVDDYTVLVSRFTVRDGVYLTSSFIVDNWRSNGLIATGRFITDVEEMYGTHSVMVTDDSENFGKQTLELFGEQYDIIGTHKSYGTIVPFLSLPEETPVTSISVRFENMISRKCYDEFVSKAVETIPGKLRFSELTLPDEESMYIYNNIMVISVLIAALTILNFAFLYNFIFRKRRRQLAIMRICGCTAQRAWLMCLGECCLICIPTFLAGMATYIPFMHGVLAELFEYMEASYNAIIYAAIFVIYVVILIVIMGLMLSGEINSELAESRKDGER